MQISLAQITPIWLNKAATLEKVTSYVDQAADEGSRLVVFGEAILPGYPYWLDATRASKFNDERQKELYAHYLREAIVLTDNSEEVRRSASLLNSDYQSSKAGGEAKVAVSDLAGLCALAKRRSIAIVLGCIERALDRGGHSCYCSLVYIDGNGSIQNVHRKLQPTYEERLCWAPGDGHGLRTFPLHGFQFGALNCWENWMPLPRAALYGQGENLHLALWPGCKRNTEILTRFLAREGRSYCVSVSGLMRRSDVPKEIPHYEHIIEHFPDSPSDGGSCVANPDGSWLLEPQVGEEGLYTVELELEYVQRERQNFDPAGHYSRPDVTKLTVDRRRQSTVEYLD
ncbi:carbon-nitrogen hydrolase [Lewinellaceae bacterium SD302]|nr:carbon-nitrogen hydrolase [Lewinellaceae bacterium SD302]